MQAQTWPIRPVWWTASNLPGGAGDQPRMIQIQGGILYVVAIDRADLEDECSYELSIVICDSIALSCQLIQI